MDRCHRSIVPCVCGWHGLALVCIIWLSTRYSASSPELVTRAIVIEQVRFVLNTSQWLILWRLIQQIRADRGYKSRHSSIGRWKARVSKVVTANPERLGSNARSSNPSARIEKRSVSWLTLIATGSRRSLPHRLSVSDALTLWLIFSCHASWSFEDCRISDYLLSFRYFP